MTASKAFQVVLCGRFHVFILVSSPSLLVVCMPVLFLGNRHIAYLL